MTPLRVGIDGYNLAIPNGTGVANYGASLAAVLRTDGYKVEGVFGIEPGAKLLNREMLFFDRFGRGHHLSKFGRLRKIGLPAGLWHFPHKLREVPLTNAVEKRSFGFRLPAFDTLWTSPHVFEIATARFKHFGLVTNVVVPNPPDVMHWTYPLPVRMLGTKNVYTIHDLVPMKLPHAALGSKTYYRRLIRECLNMSDHIVTVSEASRHDILSLFPHVDPAKVSNTYQSSAVPAEILASSADRDGSIVEHMFGVKPKEYYLFYGAVDPKKNIGRIVDGFLSSQTDKQLVIVTSRSWGMDWETRMLGKNGRVYGRKLKNKVLQLEYLPRPTLFRLIRSAKAILFPSLYEGFGLPVLEGSQLGVPSVTSNTSSLPEVCGAGGIQVDPYKAHEIAEAIRRLDQDGELYDRLCKEALVHSQRFTSEDWLARLSDVYGTVLHGKAAHSRFADAATLPVHG